MFSRDIGIDLGTANVLIHVKGKGIVLDEPAIIALDRDTGKVLEVGAEAYRMIGRTLGNIKAIRSLKEGVIDDFDLTEAMILNFIDIIRDKDFFSYLCMLFCCNTYIITVTQYDIKQ